MLRRLASEWVRMLGIPLRAHVVAPCAAVPSLHAHSRRRNYGSGTMQEYQEEIDQINDLFVEARDEIEYAKEDAETTYFNESCNDARQLVDRVLNRFQSVLGKLGDEERGRLQRSMGMKMEQLKAEVALLDTLHE